MAAHSPRHPTQERRGGQRFTGLVPSHFETPSTSKTTESRAHFFSLSVQSRNPDTSPQSSSLWQINPTAKSSFPSRLIPPYSPFLDTAPWWFFVWELIQCSQAVAAGAGRKSRTRGSSRIELSHSTEPGLKTWNWINRSEWTVIWFCLFSTRRHAAGGQPRMSENKWGLVAGGPRQGHSQGFTNTNGLYNSLNLKGSICRIFMRSYIF